MSIIDRILAAAARELRIAQSVRTQSQPGVAWPTSDERRADDAMAGDR